MPDTLLYDGDCGFCTSSARLARRIAPGVDVRPYQHADLGGSGLTAADCAAALQWVAGGAGGAGSGGPASGAAAVARLLLAAGGGWAPLGRLLLLPGLRRLAELTYRAVAAHRYRLPGGTPACRLPAEPDGQVPAARVRSRHR